jgi:hypothetical protein
MYSELHCDSDVCAIALRARSLTDTLELILRLPRFLAVAKKAQGAARTDLELAHMFATNRRQRKLHSLIRDLYEFSLSARRDSLATEIVEPEVSLAALSYATDMNRSIP